MLTPTCRFPGLFEHGARDHPQARGHHHRRGELTTPTFAETAGDVQRLARAEVQAICPQPQRP